MLLYVLLVVLLFSIYSLCGKKCIQKEYFSLDSEFYVRRSNIQGDGVFTRKSIPSNTKLFQVTDQSTKILPIARKVNHCPFNKSNTILKKYGTVYFLYSIKDINADEELTCDYNDEHNRFSKTAKNVFRDIVTLYFL